MGDALKETIFLVPVTYDEINSIVSNLKNNATGSDEISAECLEMSLPSIANPLVYIIWVVCLFQKVCSPHS